MILLKLNESSASLRVVPVPILIRASDGTSSATNESGRTFYFSIGGVDYGSGGSLSAVSAAMGMYTCNFAASKISVSGPGMVYYGLPNSSLTALAVSAPFMVVPVDSYDSMRFGMFALPNAAPGASDGLVAFGTGTGQLHVSSGSVGLKAQTHSDVTIKGIQNYANISNVTLHAGTHSDVTIQGVTRALNLSANGDKTGYTLSSIGERSVASSLLSTNLGNDRYVQDAFFVLRNRVFISGSTMTVYHPDDTTSAWTASVTTGVHTVTQIDPGGVA